MSSQIVKFGHIYYENWRIGANCQRAVNKVQLIEFGVHDRQPDANIIEMGVVISKRLCGSPRDPDAEITFEKDGKQYTHVMAFDNSYLQY